MLDTGQPITLVTTEKGRRKTFDTIRSGQRTPLDTDSGYRTTSDSIKSGRRMTFDSLSSGRPNGRQDECVAGNNPHLYEDEDLESDNNSWAARAIEEQRQSEGVEQDKMRPKLMSTGSIESPWDETEIAYGKSNSYVRSATANYKSPPKSVRQIANWNGLSRTHIPKRSYS
jgi:hypothetical protein